MTNQRLDFLNSIRGIAALLVVVGHFLDMYVKHNHSGISFDVITNFVNSFEMGRVGVVIFFLISGFVVPYSFKGKQKENTIINFAIKSLFRLYPAFWFSIMLAVFIGYGVGINILSIEQVLVNLTMLPKYLGFESVQGAYWTLHLLLVFYVLCCFLFFIGKLDNNKALIGGLIVFCLLAVLFAGMRYFYQVRIPIVMPLGVATMFLGALLRKHYTERLIGHYSLILFFIVYFGSMLIAQRLYYLEGWPRWFSAYFMAIGLFLVFVYKVNLYNNLLSYLGRISYSMYLVHMLVLALVFNFLGESAYNIEGLIIASFSTLLLSVIISDLSYRLFEMNGAKLGYKLKLEKVNAV